MTRFLLFFAVVVVGSYLFSQVRDLVGPDNYAFISMGVLMGGIIQLLSQKSISELGFWVIITLVGKNFDGVWYWPFFLMVLAYIVLSTGAITIQRK